MGGGFDFAEGLAPLDVSLGGGREGGTLDASASMMPFSNPIPSSGGCHVSTAVMSVANVSCVVLFVIASSNTSFNRRNSWTTVNIRMTICNCLGYPCGPQAFASVNRFVIVVARTDFAFLVNDASHSNSVGSKSLSPGSTSICS